MMSVGSFIKRGFFMLVKLSQKKALKISQKAHFYLSYIQKKSTLFDGNYLRSYQDKENTQKSRLFSLLICTQKSRMHEPSGGGIEDFPHLIGKFVHFNAVQGYATPQKSLLKRLVV